MLFLMFGLLSTVNASTQDLHEQYTATSVSDLNVSPEVLYMKVRPLTTEELFVEADAWLNILKRSATEVYKTKIAIHNKNSEIDLLEAKDNNQTKPDERQVIQTNLGEMEEEKSVLLEKLAKERVSRELMIKRLDAVLENIDDKMGLKFDGKENERVEPYRRYIDTVGGISIEVTDANSAWKTVTTWLMSDDGGLHWLINIIKFIVIIIFSILVAKLLSEGARKTLGHTPNNSQLLNDFIANMITKIVMLVGILVALAAIDINVGPIMAMVGAAGFVVAFALQGTLSNFASGLMIMLYRPYDIGDIVDVAGIIGTVDSMTMVSTTIVTPDNRVMIVPNNSIWGNIITNITHRDTRRVDMVFGIGYDDDITKAEEVLRSVLAANPLVLKDPEPTIAVTELADSSVNFNCRPWAKTEDYWTVYGEVTRAVKVAFDKENISIPYPQMDIHTDSANDDAKLSV